MSPVKAIALREIKSIFYSPIAYVLGAIFALLNGYTFWFIVNLINGPLGEVEGTVVELFFGGILFFWMGLLILIPSLTMRSFSEEKRMGTIELLFTSPLKESQVVLGKFFANFFFYVLLWVPSIFYVLFIHYHQSMDLNILATSYIGLLTTSVSWVT